MGDSRWSGNGPEQPPPWGDLSPADEFLFAEPTETDYAQGRLSERTYVSKSFPLNQPASQDHGQPARFIHKVFDPEGESQAVYDGSEWVISETDKGRYQFKLLVAREAGAVKELWIQRVPTNGSPGQLQPRLHLRRDDANRLIQLLRNLDHIPIEGEKTVRVDDALVQDLFADPDSLVQLYRRDPGRFRQLITDDKTASDVVALAHRREQVDRLRRLLDEPDYFQGELAEVSTPNQQRPEAVWQRFFEDNPWVLGVSLAGQLLTSWNNEKLEQTVVGASVTGGGKRTDALLRTSGRVRSMVFAEFKRHDKPLLGREYRDGCWSVSEDVAGGVAQAQGTVQQAVRDIGDRLADLAGDGSEVPGRFTYLYRPRSFLIVGQLNDLTGEAGGDHPKRIRSFELYRSSITEPEILIYDEVLARAEMGGGHTAELPRERDVN